MEKSSRISRFDSVRGLAALTVLFHHCLISLPVFWSAYAFAKIDNKFENALSYSPIHVFWAGQEAVLLFFVLSGYVLYLSMEKECSNKIRKFITIRFFRIYVPYIVSIFASIILMQIFLASPVKGLSSWFNGMWSHKVSVESILSYIFMLNIDVHNINGVTWSLVHEMRISLIFPLLYFFVKKCGLRTTIIASIFINVIVRHGISAFSDCFAPGYIKSVVTNFSDTNFYILFFICGMLFAKYAKWIEAFYAKTSTRMKFLFPIVALYFYTLKWNVARYIPMNSMSRFQWDTLEYVFKFATLLGVMLLLMQIKETRIFAKIIENKYLVFVGRISYSLYLIHLIVLLLLVHGTNGLFSPRIAICLTPFLSILLSIVFWRFVEVPSVRFGKYLSQRNLQTK